MNRTCIIILILLVLIGCPERIAAQPESYIGLWSDRENGQISAHNVDGTTLFDLWVWVNPGDYGVICVEYKLELPEDLSPQTVELNPTNSVALGEPLGPPGLSICFPECQRDWFWVSRAEILLTDRIERYFGLSGHDYTGEVLAANCTDGYPVEPMVNYTQFQINTALPPILTGIEITGPSTLVAVFDREVIEDCLYSIEILPENISLFEKDNPSNIVDVKSVEIVGDELNKLDIILSSELDSNKIYKLTSTHVCAWGNYGFMSVSPVCGDSEIEFSGTVATTQSSWGAIKSLVH